MGLLNGPSSGGRRRLWKRIAVVVGAFIFATGIAWVAFPSVRARISEPLVDRALARGDDGDWASEERTLRLATRIDPSCLRAWAFLANILYWSRDPARRPEAKESLNRALALEPVSAKEHIALGIALVQAVKTRAAIREIRLAVHLEPGEAAYRQWLAWALLLAGDWDEAAEAYRDVSGLTPTDKYALYNLGRALLYAGRSAEAADELKRAVDILPDDGPISLTLAMACSNIGQWEEALTYSKQALELDPGSHQAHAVYLKACWHLGKIHDALRASEERVRKDPKDAMAHEDIGRILCWLGDPTASAEAVRKAAEAAPDDPWLAQLYGKSLVSIGDLRGAEREYGRAVRLYSQPPPLVSIDVYCFWVGAAAELDDNAVWQECVSQIESSHADYPDNVVLLTALGYARLSDNDLGAAEKLLENALLIGHGEGVPHAVLGHLLLTQGRPEEAVEMVEECLRIRPHYRPVEELLEQAYRERDALRKAEGEDASRRASSDQE